MTASDVIERFKSLGYDLRLRDDGKLIVRPCPPDHEAPRLAPLARLAQRYRAELIQLLQSERPPDVSDVSDMSSVSDEAAPTLPINLSRIVNAIAAHPRSPFLNDLAIATVARHAVEAQRTIERLPTAAKVEALARCREVEDRIVSAINSLNYQSAYNIAATLARLPDELNRFALQ
jgi:ribosomal protein L17